MSESDRPMDELPADGGSAQTAPPRPTVEWEEPSSAPVPGGAEGTAGPVVRLWSARDVGISSFLLGFPGGFGLVARNAYRIGRRGTALVHLLVGAAILLLIFFLPIPRALGVPLNFGIAYALYSIVKRQAASATAMGSRVEGASAGAGIATFLGGWIAIGGPVIALIVALSFLGGQVGSILAGTMEFGASGAGCQVDSVATTLPASGPVHYVAYLSRELRAGETVTLTVSEQALGQVGTDEMSVASTVDCVSGTLPGGTLSAGTYSFDFKVGAEGVAGGRLVLSP